MRRLILSYTLMAAIGGGALTAQAVGAPPPPPERVTVKAGTYLPFYPASPDEKEIRVGAYQMDRVPVTNAQFLSFVTQNPKWRKDRVSSLFADKNYLTHWASPTQLGAKALADQPVTNVSWYAAKAYCQAQGARLPTENEWEYAASASESAPNGRSDMAWRQRVLEWYTLPAAKTLPSVGQGKPNYWGLQDMHGLVWEWVLDFNNSLITVDSRSGKDEDKTRFCGAGSQIATEKEDYASFMRIAFRNSLKADYTTSNLGFRCTQEAPH